jgi:hypothetical protein
MIRTLLLAVCLAGLCMQAAPVLQLNPASGVVSGAPGSTIGWGFTLTNTSDFVLVNGSSFTPFTLYGTYQDFIGAFNFIVAGPAPESPTVTQAFNLAAHTGIGAFSILSTAPPGTLVLGNLVINYSVFSQSPNDPNFNPDTSTIVSDASLTVPVTVNIAPEPASGWLLMAGALVLACGTGRFTQHKFYVTRRGLADCRDRSASASRDFHCRFYS